MNDEEKIVKNCFSKIKSDLKYLMMSKNFDTQQIVEEAIDTIAIITLMLKDMEVEKNIQREIQRRINEIENGG